MSTQEGNKGKGFPLFTMALVAISIFIGIICGRIIEKDNDNAQVRDIITKLSEPKDKISYTLSLIDGYYVDKIPLDTLAEDVIPAILKELDPHSVYIPAKEMQQVNEPLEGEFDGVGIVFNMATDTIKVINVVPKGPSEKAGIIGGDCIITINDSLVAGKKIPQSDVMKLLRGKRGSKVNLGIERQGAGELLSIEVERGVIPIHSVGAKLILEDSIGYIKMMQFARNTYQEIVTAIAELKVQGMTDLILDLRGNSGGYLDQAIAIANEFLPANNLIVYTEDRNGEQRREYSDGSGLSTDLNVAVLIDESSASSSEILAGALQDNDRGIIMGRRSFGKGLVQQQIPFHDGSAMRLTIARYYTPTGRSIQKPYVKGEGEEYEDDLSQRIKHNELFVADSIHFVDSLKRVTPKGKVVYGGGGIMPDIFIPADTTDITTYFIKVTARNILYNYTTRYTDKHRKEINAITTIEQLNDHFAANPNILNDFVAYAARKGVPANWREINISRDLIEAQLKGYIGRNTPLDDNGFYINIYPIDDVTMRAIDVLKNGTDEIEIVEVDKKS